MVEEDKSLHIHELQKVMKEKNITFFFVPSEDFHLSEYVAPHFKGREYLSHFTGSAGYLLVSQDKAYLWVDGRYFIQGEEETKDVDLVLFKMGLDKVPTLEEFLKENLNSHDTLAFDFKTVSISRGTMFEKILNSVDGKIINLDLLEEVWLNRPPLTSKHAFLLDETLAGKSRQSKLNKVQNYLKTNHDDLMIINALDEVNYLFNIRGEDVLYSPVLYSYGAIYQNKVCLYLFSSIEQKIKDELIKENIIIRDYEEIYRDLNLDNQTILLDDTNTNFYIYYLVKDRNKVIFKPSIIKNMKAVKNDIELANIRQIHILDGVALFRLIDYLKHNNEEKSEISISEKLLKLRQQNKNFLYPSFGTICAFKEHGAIVHYEADMKTNKKVTTNSFLLLDSGGQYLGGTTDVTRTIVLGTVDAKMKKHFTLALSAHLKLLYAKYDIGMNGADLDLLARNVLWKEKLDYLHGTGHGVGYMLNVHEGPCGFSYRSQGYRETPLAPGMVISDEPGLYFANEYGIRHENLIEVRKVDDTHLENYPLTYVPFDLEGVDKAYLSEEDIRLLNQYHQAVYKNLSPYLNEKEKEYLKELTKAI